jgi:hypothetical protein
VARGGLLHGVPDRASATCEEKREAESAQDRLHGVTTSNL